LASLRIITYQTRLVAGRSASLTARLLNRAAGK
jgi:hypothetical protein